MEETKNQDYVYACSWYYLFDAKTMYITKLPVEEKDLKKVEKSIYPNNGHSLYYCDTLEEAVRSWDIDIGAINFVNVSKEEIKQVKKEVNCV
jgi:hypothetical protein